MISKLMKILPIQKIIFLKLLANDIFKTLNPLLLNPLNPLNPLQTILIEDFLTSIINNKTLNHYDILGMKRVLEKI